MPDQSSRVPPTPRSPRATDHHELMADMARRAGITRVHLVAFRDRDHPEAGGSEEHAVQIADHLRRSGLEVAHHTGAVPGGPRSVDRDGVQVMRRGGKLGVFATTVVDELAGRMGPRDGLIEIFHGVPFFAPLWARGPRVAFIHHVHLGTWHHLVPKPADRVGELLEGRLVPLVYRNSTIVTAAESARDEIVSELGLSADRIHIAPHGIDPRYVPGGARADQPTVLAVARMMPQKGLADLLPILAEVRSRVPDLQAVVVGDGPQRPELERQRSALGATEWLEFAGRVDDAELVEHYRRAWVAVSASHREGFGLTLTEAAACGTPVVATRIPGHLDAVSDGHSGVLVDDHHTFVDAVERLLVDHSWRDQLATGALEWSSRFRWEASAAAVLAALCDDAQRRRR